MRWALALVAALAAAAEPDPAADRTAFIAALTRAPGIAAAQQRALAAERAIGAAGVLPDPMLSGDLGRKRPSMGDDTRLYGLMLEQPLPRWGERAAARASARAAAGAAGAERDDVLGEHAAELALMLSEAAAAEIGRAHV